MYPKKPLYKSITKKHIIQQDDFVLYHCAHQWSSDPSVVKSKCINAKCQNWRRRSENLWNCWTIKVNKNKSNRETLRCEIIAVLFISLVRMIRKINTPWHIQTFFVFSNINDLELNWNHSKRSELKCFYTKTKKMKFCRKAWNIQF